MSTAPQPARPSPPAPDPDPSGSAQPVPSLGQAASRPPLHARDRVPRFLMRAQTWLYGWLSDESRLRLSLIIVVLAVFVAVVLSSSRLLRHVLEGLDVVAMLSLFVVNWLGNGGALVPIPGARFVGLLLIFQQAAILPSLEVLAAAGAAMALGLTSYYVAGARTAESFAEGDTEGAEQLAHRTGMLDDEAVDFAPGSELDALAVSAISGVTPAEAILTDEPGTREAPVGGLRQRFTTSLRRAQERAEPILEQRGTTGMFLLCFAPTPLSAAAAYVGGVMRFGFARFLLAAFASKYLLAAIVVALAIVFSDAAASVDIPEVHIPIVDVTLFDDGPPGGPPPPASPVP